MYMKHTRTDNTRTDISPAQNPFQRKKTNIVHDAVLARLFSLPGDNQYQLPPNTTLSSYLSLGDEYTPPEPFSFTCRQGKVLMVRCQTPSSEIYPKDPTYQYELLVNKLESTNYNDMGPKYAEERAIYNIPARLIRKHICPILTNGSICLSYNGGIQTTEPQALTRDKINNLDISTPNGIVLLNSISDLYLNSTNTNQTTALEQYNKPVLDFTSVRYASEIDPVQTLSCENKGYASDLYYEAKPWEAFVCTHEKQPKLTVAICGPDGTMHTASFIKELLPNTVNSFKLGESNPYKCFIQDPLWTKYSQLMQKQGITENQLKLDSSIYPAIKNADIPVTICKTPRKEFTSCAVTLKFDKYLITKLALQTKFDNGTISQIIQHPIVQDAQIGSTVESHNITTNTALAENVTEHCTLRKQSNTNTDTDYYLTNAILLFIIGIASTIALTLVCLMSRILVDNMTLNTAFPNRRKHRYKRIHNKAPEDVKDKKGEGVEMQHMDSNATNETSNTPTQNPNNNEEQNTQETPLTQEPKNDMTDTNPSEPLMSPENTTDILNP